MAKITLNIDSAPAKKGAESLEKTLQKLDARADAIIAKMKAVGAAMDRFKSFNSLGNSLDKVSGYAEKSRSSFERMRRALEELTTSSNRAFSNFGKVYDLLYQAEQKVTKAQKARALAQEKLSKAMDPLAVTKYQRAISRLNEIEKVRADRSKLLNEIYKQRGQIQSTTTKAVERHTDALNRHTASTKKATSAAIILQLHLGQVRRHNVRYRQPPCSCFSSLPNGPRPPSGR